jgi:hypothetical protein
VRLEPKREDYGNLLERRGDGKDKTPLGNPVTTTTPEPHDRHEGRGGRTESRSGRSRTEDNSIRSESME